MTADGVLSTESQFSFRKDIRWYMENNALYETAKVFAGVLKQRYPYLDEESDACLALIGADSGSVVSGVSSIAINEGTPEVLPAEKIAAMSLITSGETARQMIIITIDDNSFFEDEDLSKTYVITSNILALMNERMAASNIQWYQDDTTGLFGENDGDDKDDIEDGNKEENINTDS